MRNPIQPSPDRPIPLPDCILMDGWWADREDKAPVRADTMLCLVTGERQQIPRKRTDRDDVLLG